MTKKALLSMVMVAVLLLGMNMTGYAAAKKPLPPQDAPTASMASGTYDGPQIIRLSGPAGATIRYTINGRTPTASSTKYTKPITVVKKTTIKAIAVRKGYSNSPILSATYNVRPIVLDAPVASLTTGSYDGTQYVKLSGPAGATIRYTLNGRTPTASSTRYSKAIKVTNSTTIKAIAVRTGYANSPVLTVSIGINTPLPSTAYIPANQTFPLGGGSVVIKAPKDTTIYLMMKGLVDDGRQISTKDFDYKLLPGHKVTVSVRNDLDVQMLLVKKGYANTLITRTYLIRTEQVEPMGDDFCAAVLEGINSDRWEGSFQLPDGTIITNVAPAIMDSNLSAIAQAHAMKLATEDRLYHTGMNYDESVAGPISENPHVVGVRSVTHNPALGAPWNTHIGVGAARALSGLYYVVVMAETDEKAAQNN